MAWTVEFHPDAEKEFARFDRSVQKLIGNYLRTRIANGNNPRQFGKPLTHDKAGLWRYRIDKYRIICKIEDNAMVVLVVRIAKRDVVYDM